MAASNQVFLGSPVNDSGSSRQEAAPGADAEDRGAGMQVTMTEINAAYNAYARTGAPPRACPELPELLLSYTDFALWQRGRVQPGGGLESQVCCALAPVECAPMHPPLAPSALLGIHHLGCSAGCGRVK